MKHGRSCDFEISVPSCDIFNLWFIIFQCIISTVGYTITLNSYHGLRGSASPVLTATAWPCKWEMEIFDPHRIHTLNRPPKNLSQVITSATPTSMPHLVEIRSWGLLGKWVKYNDFLLICQCTFYRELTYISHPSTVFHVWWLKRRWHAQGVPFGLILLLILEVKFFTNPQFFWAWIGVFNPNEQNIKSFILSKLRHRFQLNFAQRMIETTTLSSTNVRPRNPRWRSAAM